MLKRMSFCDSEGSEAFDDILFGWKGENVSFVLFHLNRRGALLYCKRPKISEKIKRDITRYHRCCRDENPKK